MVKQRIGGILRVIRSAAPVETEMAALWALIQSDFYGNQKAILAPLAAAGQLRAGLILERAADIALDPEPPGRVAAAARRAGLDPGGVRDVVGRQQLRAAVARPVTRARWQHWLPDVHASPYAADQPPERPEPDPALAGHPGPPAEAWYSPVPGMAATAQPGPLA